MRNKCLLLLRIQFLGLFGFNKMLHAKDSKEKRKLALFCLLFIFLVGMLGFYSYMIASGFAEQGMASLLPPLLLLLTSAVTLFTTILRTNGVLFGFRDYDMVMSLPVTSRIVITSRLLFLYLMNFIFVCIFLIPASFVYVTATAASASIWIMIILSLFFTPLIPMVIATLFGVLVTAASVRFRHKNLITLFLNVLLILAVMLVSFSMQNIQMEAITTVGSTISQGITSAYPPAALYNLAIQHNNWGFFLLFVAISVAVAALFVLFFSLFFTKINTILLSHRAGKKFKMEQIKASSPFASLYRKEMRKYFATPMYVLNTSLGAILLLILSILSLFFSVPQLLAQIGEGADALGIWINRLAPLLVTFFVTVSTTTACSLSLEGKNRWIVYSSPVASKSIFASKIAVNLTIFLPTILICGILLAIGLRTSVLDTILLFVVPIVYCFFISVMGLVINLRFPNYEWSNEMAVIKQSASVIVSMLIGMGSAILPLVLTLFLPCDPRIIVLSAAVIVTAITVFFSTRLRKTTLAL